MSKWCLPAAEQCVALQSAASETFGPNSRAAAEELLAAVEESNRRKSASDGLARCVSADVQALVRDSRRQSLRMPTTSPNVPERRPSIGERTSLPMAPGSPKASALLPLESFVQSVVSAAVHCAASPQEPRVYSVLQSENPP